MLKRIFLIFHKLIPFYEYLMILIHREYKMKFLIKNAFIHMKIFMNAFYHEFSEKNYFYEEFDTFMDFLIFFGIYRN